MRESYPVIGIDDLSYGLKRQIPKGIKFYKKDIRDSAIYPLFKGADIVFHLAAKNCLEDCQWDPVATASINVYGTVNVFEAANRAGVKRMIYTQSSAVEEGEKRARGFYAVSKISDELFAEGYEAIGLTTVGLRYFNVYGPRSRTSGTYGAVFGVFLSQKLGGKPYTIVGDGSQSRDFTYVTDVVDAIVCAAKSSTYNEVFNVGSGGHYSVNYLVELLGGGHTVHIPKRPGEPDKTFADITKIKEKLNWQPKTSFEQGVKNILAEIDYWKNAPVWTPETIKQATKTWFEYLN
jgi:UDP-glucose 4-epimerase